jgi:Cu+-exporting ATPase
LDGTLQGLFRILMFLLACPVVFYSASDYYKSAWYGLKNKIVNIDVPIVLGILFFSEEVFMK